MKKLAVVLASLFLAAAIAAPGCKDRQSTDSQTPAAPPAGAATTSPATAPASQPTTGPAAASKPAWTIDPALPAKDLAEYNQKMEELKKQFPCVQFKDWKGMKFTFRPDFSSSLPKLDYINFEGGKGEFGQLPYEEAFGRIGTVSEVKITKDQDVKYDITLKMDDNGQEYKTIVYDAKDKPSGEPLPSSPEEDNKFTKCIDLIPMADIEKARSLWKGKAFWYKYTAIGNYPLDFSYKSETIKLKRFSPLKVIGVEAGWPILLVLETESGKKGSMLCRLSGTNEHYKPNEVNMRWNLDEIFFLENPRKLYSWDDKTWKAIEDGIPFIGMTIEQAKLCCGYDPGNIKHIKSDDTATEIWTYKTFSLTFENGAISKIENKSTN